MWIEKFTEGDAPFFLRRDTPLTKKYPFDNEKEVSPNQLVIREHLFER